jgi:hypothetical protein
MAFFGLCTPAYVYLVISVIAMVVILFQNMGSATNLYCLGMYQCDVADVTMIFIIKIVYVIFWTWVLNLICQQGYTPVSWLLVLLPFILFFVLLAMLVWQA